jgi:hypothetical protein
MKCLALIWMVLILNLGWDTGYSGGGLSRGFPQLLQEYVNVAHQIIP